MKLSRVLERHGNPIYEVIPSQDKSRVNKCWHDITDIPTRVLVFRRASRRDSTENVKKFITYCTYGGDNWYPNDGDLFVIQIFMDREMEKDS
jgi:hypothetical protein